MKKCSFFGHRNIEFSSKLEQNLTVIIEDLIVNKAYTTFLFGSNSQFNDLCHLVVTKLKEKYPFLQRIIYTCKSESFILESEKEKWREIYNNSNIKKDYIQCFEQEFEHKTKYTAGKAGYIERNQAMIDDSDLCIFYYNESYKPNSQKTSKKSLSNHRPQSGTKLAFDYATKNNKLIINVKNAI